MKVLFGVMPLSEIIKIEQLFLIAFSLSIHISFNLFSRLSIPDSISNKVDIL